MFIVQVVSSPLCFKTILICGEKGCWSNTACSPPFSVPVRIWKSTPRPMERIPRSKNNVASLGNKELILLDTTTSEIPRISRLITTRTQRLFKRLFPNPTLCIQSFVFRHYPFHILPSHSTKICCPFHRSGETEIS